MNGFEELAPDRPPLPDDVLQPWNTKVGKKWWFKTIWFKIEIFVTMPVSITIVGMQNWNIGK